MNADRYRCIVVSEMQASHDHSAAAAVAVTGLGGVALRPRDTS